MLELPQATRIASRKYMYEIEHLASINTHETHKHSTVFLLKKTNHKEVLVVGLGRQ